MYKRQTNTYKVGKWATTNLNLGTANCPVVVNTDALNALELAHKQALLGSIDEAMAFYVSNYDNNTNRKYEAAIKETGLKQVTFSAAQTEKLNELAETVREDWIKDNSNSFNAQELFDFTQALVNE